MFQAKSDKSMRRAIMGGQAHLVLKSAVTGWRELLATLRQERIMEKPKEENSWYKAATSRGLRKLRVEEEKKYEEAEEEEEEEGRDCA